MADNEHCAAVKWKPVLLDVGVCDELWCGSVRAAAESQPYCCDEGNVKNVHLTELVINSVLTLYEETIPVSYPQQSDWNCEKHGLASAPPDDNHPPKW